MRKIFLALIFCFLAIPLTAQTIQLKSGRVIEGRITEQTDDYIRVDFRGVSITYYLDEIESIDGKPAQKQTETSIRSRPGPASPQPNRSKNLKESNGDIDTFFEAITELKQNYVERPELKELIYNAMRGMLYSLDPYSRFLTPEDYKELGVATTGEFGGLGIEITMREGVLTIVSPMEDTPAWRAGIQPGDIIAQINQESTQNITLKKAVETLRGKPGTDVSLMIVRPETQEVLEVEITREIIQIQDIRNASILEDNIGYLRIADFRQSTAKDLEIELAKFKRENFAGLIVDVRNNPGGLLTSAIAVSDLFLEEGSTIVSIDGRNQEKISYGAQFSFGKILDIPIIVIINRGSASASEILAGALRDNNRAKLLGETTFGKGSVQSVFPLADGSALLFTTSRYYTPSGISIDKEGIEPDIIVEKERISPSESSYQRLEREEEFDYKKDPKIMRALEVIKKSIQ